MSALEEKERFQVICYGKTTNYWSTDDKEEAEFVFDSMVKNFFQKRYHKIVICEWEGFGYMIKNEVLSLGRVSR